MSEERMESMLDRVRETYHVPGEPPREAIWSAVEARIADAPAGGRGSSGADVVELATVRARRIGARDSDRDRSLGWAVAAAAVLVLGIGIGRMTAPAPPVAGVAPGTGSDASHASISLAARDHLGRTESLLTMVRADARAGRVDPATAQWASGLLSETRILLDADGVAEDPSVQQLLLDLELVLIQVVGVAETGSVDEARARTELELALRTLENGEVLPRIQAVLPVGLEGV